MHIFYKRYHEAALIIFACDYVFSSSLISEKVKILILKVQLFSKINPKMVSDFKLILIQKISDEIVINHEAEVFFKNIGN